MYDIVKKRNEECLNIVIEASERYKALEALNSTYDFHENLRPSYVRRWTVNSKQQLDRFNFEQRSTDEIANNLRTLCDQCNHGKSDKWDEDGLN